jgi:hypothetical protein
MLSYKEYLLEKINYDTISKRNIFFEFGEGSILDRTSGISHIRDNFNRTINTIKIKGNREYKNPDMVFNKVPINKDQILDDITFAIPQIYDLLIRGRVELMRGFGNRNEDICSKIDPLYSPNPNGIILLIKNVKTGLNTVLGLDSFKQGISDIILLTGVTVIWKDDFKNYCLRDDNVIEIYNDNISKFYTTYPKIK